MPNQIIDFDKFVIWRASGGHYGTDLFICSHGGYDETDAMFDLPEYGTGKPKMYFYGNHGKSITEGVCNGIIASENPAKKATSIVGPGSSCWNYTLIEYPRDWFEAATGSAVQAMEKFDVLHDCLLIKGSSDEVKLQGIVNTLAKKGIKYINYHYMSCRSIV